MGSNFSFRNNTNTYLVYKKTFHCYHLFKLLHCPAVGDCRQHHHAAEDGGHTPCMHLNHLSGGRQISGGH